MKTSRPNDSSDSAREERYFRELDQLCRFSGTIGSANDIEGMVRDTIDPLQRMAEAEQAIVAVGLEDPHLLVPVATLNWEPSVDIADGLPASAVAALGTEAVGAKAAEGLPPALATRLAGLEGSLAIVPLWAHARLRGVAILARRDRPFDPGTLKLLTAAGRQLACAAERSQLFADLQQSYSKLMSAQEGLIRSERMAAVGQLSATLAHEIRNPLATIFSAISQIRKHTKTDDISATLLDIAEEEAVRLNQMVNGLLEFARPRKPSFELGVPAEVAADVVRRTVEAGEGAATVELECDPAVERLALNFDPELIHRALSLLVANAVQAVEGTDGRIAVRVLPAEARSDVIMEVTDNGVGIPEELLERVCDPFFSTRPSGTGLGLPTVKRIIEDHGGTLRIDSTAGTGTTIRLFLPAKYQGVPVEEDDQ